jgi:hypothetical protein
MNAIWRPPHQNKKKTEGVFRENRVRGIFVTEQTFKY